MSIVDLGQRLTTTLEMNILKSSRQRRRLRNLENTIRQYRKENLYQAKQEREEVMAAYEDKKKEIERL